MLRDAQVLEDSFMLLTLSPRKRGGGRGRSLGPSHGRGQARVLDDYASTFLCW